MLIRSDVSPPHWPYIDTIAGILKPMELDQNLVTWNQTYDCCDWGGMECDGAGRVISLFLDSERISRGFGESSTLFQLTYLYSELSLRWNDFSTSEIPNQFHRLKYLRHLDLSRSGFVGSIPSTISVNVCPCKLSFLHNQTIILVSSNYHSCITQLSQQGGDLIE
ncbi:hypothetical protein SASPL_156693 [Salvia splendens]|uniref:Leucine-rich repeat-containing N-terminal plant-type domain-containing protein n=1 Tax=Salvia splendens TaxID=180675 RepID=A0A8X8VW85_SALSN|nr:hypothetical protein SASPL_156693 [Salvia splendens]